MSQPHDRIRREELYRDAVTIMKRGSIEDYKSAIEMFEKAQGFEDSEKKLEECRLLLNAAQKKAAFKKKFKRIFLTVFLAVALVLTVVIIYLRSIIFLKVEDMEFKLRNDEYILRKYKGEEESFEIPREVRGKPVTGIEGAFSYCEALKSVSIPDSVTLIGDRAFSGCKNLREITIPDSVTEIGYSAFSHCSLLKTITLPESVTLIGSFAFFDCSRLETVIIPDSVTFIDDSAFYDCRNLKEIILPDSLSAINSSLFFYCVSLERVYIPASVTEIGENAFFNCKKLTVVCSGGSYAEEYAKANNIRYEIAE